MAIWMALFAMVCWGIAPIFAKLGLNNVNPLSGLVLRTFLAASLVTTWLGFNGGIQEINHIPFRSWLLIGIEAILATLIGDLAYYRAIKYGNVAVVSIIMSTSPVITMICSSFIFGEPFTIWRFLGVCYIIFGMILII